MRKDERDDKIAEIRDSPTVQLLNVEEEEEGHLDADTLVELNTQLKTVEDELRRLKPEYQSPINNLYIGNTSQIYPEDRGTNYSVKIAGEIVSLISRRINER